MPFHITAKQQRRPLNKGDQHSSYWKSTEVSASGQWFDPDKWISIEDQWFKIHINGKSAKALYDKIDDLSAPPLPKHLCSFCAKSHTEVKQIFANGEQVSDEAIVFICDECVTRCATKLTNKGSM